MAEKLADRMDSFERQNKANIKKVKSGKMSEEEYHSWLKKKAHAQKKLREMIEVLCEDTYNTNAIAAQMIRGNMLDAYAIHANYAAYDIDKQIGYDTSYTLYNRDAVERLLKESPDLLPDVKVKKDKDKKWNRKKFRNEITQGILQGESIQKMAGRLEKVVGMNRKAAIRNARTATTSAENGGRMNSFRRAIDLGVDMTKLWLATMDGSTRHSHRALDGQEVPMEEPFESEHGEIMYPGDPYADPAELYNCRCRLRGITKYSNFNARDMSKRFVRLPEGTTYEQWKAGKEGEDVA